MAIVACRECKLQVSDLASNCPHCGARRLVQEAAPKKAVKWWIAVPLGMLALFLFVAAFHRPTPEDREMDGTRAGIDLCWENQNRKSNDPGTARFIAGACERMEADFVTKYGRKP